MNRTIPGGAPIPRVDKYHVYRPLLDLIGFTEGTDKKRGYNETLAYGAYTGGDVDLVSMTMKQIDELQGRMLANPKNKHNSSALGRYQIVRTTRRNIQKALSIPSTALFDADMQDRMACFLLGQRGIDKYLAGRLNEDTLLTNLSKEWASLPGPNGKGAYPGQNAAVTPERVRNCLSEVRNRHAKGQPVKEVPVTVEVEKPVVPEKVEQKVKEKSNWLTWLTGGGGLGTIGLGWLSGMDWQAIVAGGVVLVVVLLVLVLLRSQIIAAVREIKAEVAE